MLLSMVVTHHRSKSTKPHYPSGCPALWIPYKIVSAHKGISPTPSNIVITSALFHSPLQQDKCKNFQSSCSTHHRCFVNVLSVLSNCQCSGVIVFYCLDWRSINAVGQPLDRLHAATPWDIDYFLLVNVTLLTDRLTSTRCVEKLWKLQGLWHGFQVHIWQ